MKITTLASIFIYLYILFRAILPLRTKRWKKLALAAATGAVGFSSLLLHIGADGPYVSPRIPGALLVMASWGYTVCFFFTILLVAADVVRAASRPARHVKFPVRLRKFRVPKYAVDLLLLVAASFLASCGMVNGIAKPKVIEPETGFVRLPAELDNFRIVLVTDLHVDDRRPPEYLPWIVERINRLDPDLVAIAGDFADGRITKLAPRLEALRNIRSRYGVFGVPGNHEYYSGYRKYMDLLNELGIVMLENSHRMVRPELAIAGVTDPAALKYGLPLPDVQAALRGIPPEAFVILLAHRPQCGAAEAAKLGVDLQLSGHTHGGLVWGFGWLVGRMNGGFVAGSYQVGEMTLYVSRGTSTWGRGILGFPARIGVPAEITLVTLRRR